MQCLQKPDYLNLTFNWKADFNVGLVRIASSVLRREQKRRDHI